MNHPRFPDGMWDDQIKDAIADEVDVTLAGFPSKRPLEQAITAYAEQLDGFTPDDIRAGFREARKQATDYAPSPSQVFACVGTACRRRRAMEQPRRDVAYPEPLSPEQIPDWRTALRGPDPSEGIP